MTTDIRLLKLGEDGNFTFCPFARTQNPRYAILSHTWSEKAQDEVQYKDLVGHAYADKKGLVKLDFCARQAKSEGIQYFWIDTCCINKESSSELQTAITSMYTWYNRSEKCYVYLSDVSARATMCQENPPAWHSTFVASRWFTRGWTLQELLAPRIVEFYSQEGTLLGDKQSLLTLINNATGIRVEALQGQALNTFSEAEKMSWMRGRATREAEDRAYAMIGLFDVSMGPIYGEGFDKANWRLQEAIRVEGKRLRLKSVIAERQCSPDTLRSYDSVFTDDLIKEKECIDLLQVVDMDHVQRRVEEPVHGTLLWLQETVQFKTWLEKGPSLMILTGPPGCGKTTISNHVMHFLSQRPSIDVVCRFFCSSNSQQQRNLCYLVRTLIHQVYEKFRKMARLVRSMYEKHPRLYEHDRELWLLLKRFMQRERNSTFAIVIDGMDECDHVEQKVLVRDISTLVSSDVSPRLKVFLASRPDSTALQSIQRAKTPHIVMNLEEHQQQISKDIELLIKARITELQTQFPRADVAGELAHRLLHRAETSFLWTSLALDHLQMIWANPLQDLLDLSFLNPKLEVLYCSCLERIPPEQKMFIQKMFRVTFSSTRPLHCKEISELLSQSHELMPGYSPLQLEERIKRALPGLFRIKDLYIHPVNHSLREFLLHLGRDSVVAEDREISHNHSRDYANIRHYGIDPQRDALELATSCLKYLLTRESPILGFDSSDSSTTTSRDSLVVAQEPWIECMHQFELGSFDLFSDAEDVERQRWTEVLQQHSLFEYAAVNWFTHARDCSETAIAILADDFSALCDPSRGFGQDWIRFLRLNTSIALEFPQEFDAAIVAAYFDLPHLIAIMSKSEIDDKDLQSALYWAARKGNTACIQQLLLAMEKSVGFSEIARDHLPPAPFLAAAEFSQSGSFRELLLSGRYDINVTDVTGSSALIYSATAGCTSIVQELMKMNELKYNDTDLRGRTALSWAAGEGHTDIVRTLLRVPESKVDAGIADTGGCTPLMYAVKGGHANIIKELAHCNRANAAAFDRDGRSAISWWAMRQWSKSSILKHLVKADPHGVDQVDCGGWTPLAWTLGTPGRLKNATALLTSAGANPEISDFTGRTPLSYAAGYGDLEMVRLLLRNAATQGNSKDEEGRTPLLFAAWYGKLDVVEELIGSPKVSAKATDRMGRGMMIYAILGGHPHIVEWLVRTDPLSPRYMDILGHDALWYAAEHNHRDLLPILQQTNF